MITGLIVSGFAIITEDPKYSDQYGTTFFPIETNRKWKRKDGAEVENPSSFYCSAYGETAKTCRALKKGAYIHLAGDLDQKVWTDKNGQERKGYRITLKTVVPLSATPQREPGDESENPDDMPDF